MILTRPVVDRRTFLRASGVAMGLPLLESMAPALARAAAVEAPRRLVTICSTLGLYSSSWFPKTAGVGYEATEYLRLIDGHRSRYTLFSGFSHEEQSGRQPHNSGDHVADGGAAPRARRVPQQRLARPGGGERARLRDALPLGGARHVERAEPVVHHERRHGAGRDEPRRPVQEALPAGHPRRGRARGAEPERRRQHPRPPEVADDGASPPGRRRRPAEARRLLRRRAGGRAGAHRGAGVARPAEAGRRRRAAHRHPEPRRPRRPHPAHVPHDPADSRDGLVARGQHDDPRPRRRAAGAGGERRPAQPVAPRAGRREDRAAEEGRGPDRERLRRPPRRSSRRAATPAARCSTRPQSCSAATSATPTPTPRSTCRFSSPGATSRTGGTSCTRAGTTRRCATCS